ncbi:MAG: hypothetical protein ACPGES_09120, partial [Coraliomargarita sp.]
MKTLFPVLLLGSLALFTGCETMKNTLYEPVPFDEIAHQLDISMEEAEALGLVQPKPALEPIIETLTSFIPAPG